MSARDQLSSTIVHCQTCLTSDCSTFAPSPTSITGLIDTGPRTSSLINALLQFRGSRGMTICNCRFDNHCICDDDDACHVGVALSTQLVLLLLFDGFEA